MKKITITITGEVSDPTPVEDINNETYKVRIDSMVDCFYDVIEPTIVKVELSESYLQADGY